ncbi:MAG: phosphoribosyl 1,2-cyclic phosphate phosphodiesterase [Rugosibacter sp.]|jgi:phosphoribosyl 1,2-cyclic phosphate phosphodiesterase|nr:phosphoribosyl 1,2-cyclic phosphate phosphodiesterase [Rugosibacter sp.]
MRISFLGSGAAGGVPLWGCDCPACQRARTDQHFMRRPNCALVEAGGVRLLLDAGVMDIAERFAPDTLAAILLTHFHADHVQGLFHWRWGVGELDVYAPHDSEGCADLYKYPGPLKFMHRTKFEAFEIGDLRITPVPLVHSKPTLGYCIEYEGVRLAYLTDSRELPPKTAEFLRDWQAHTICLDCTYPPGMSSVNGARNHFDLSEALALSDAYPDSRLVLMHIGHQLDAWLINHPDALGGRVSVARDGVTLDIGAPC